MEIAFKRIKNKYTKRGWEYIVKRKTFYKSKESLHIIVNFHLRKGTQFKAQMIVGMQKRQTKRKNEHNI